MKVEYDTEHILISFSMAFLGAYASITLCEQYRLYSSKLMASKFLSARSYLLLMALSLGAIGVWCMHFIGEDAVKLRNPQDSTQVKIYYNIPLTLVSLALVIVFVAAGLAVSSYDCVFMKTKMEIIDMFVGVSRNAGLSHGKKFNFNAFIFLVTTKSMQHLICGGFLTGSGVVVMHYVGMSAMRFQGTIKWDYGIIMASVIIAFLAATAAFWILFRLLSIYPGKEILRIISSLLMAVAVCGMHYTGVRAATFDFDPDSHEPSADADSWNMSSVTAYRTGLVLGVGMFVMAVMIAMADLRFAVQRLSTELARADDLILHLNLDRHSAANQHVQHYLRRRKLAALQQKPCVGSDSDCGADCTTTAKPGEQSTAIIGGFVLEGSTPTASSGVTNHSNNAASSGAPRTKLHRTNSADEHSVTIREYRFKSMQQQQQQQEQKQPHKKHQNQQQHQEEEKSSNKEKNTTKTVTAPIAKKSKRSSWIGSTKIIPWLPSFSTTGAADSSARAASGGAGGSIELYKNSSEKEGRVQQLKNAKSHHDVDIESGSISSAYTLSTAALSVSQSNSTNHNVYSNTHLSGSTASASYQLSDTPSGTVSPTFSSAAALLVGAEVTGVAGAAAAAAGQGSDRTNSDWSDSATANATANGAFKTVALLAGDDSGSGGSNNHDSPTAAAVGAEGIEELP